MGVGGGGGAGGSGGTYGAGCGGEKIPMDAENTRSAPPRPNLVIRTSRNALILNESRCRSAAEHRTDRDKQPEKDDEGAGRDHDRHEGGLCALHQRSILRPTSQPTIVTSTMARPYHVTTKSGESSKQWK